ncbi:MAG: aminoacyl-tRNA hydrolase [Candidatus Omnitrophica bacterium]|nr:aminoacyl-tRNA hydrolase [Candidatus Omnitrophota bacterium]
MKLIVGLGNPGIEYADTRHNAGRLLIELAASKQKILLSRKKALKAYGASVEWDGCSVFLAYPDTWMNLSGESVKRLVNHFEIDPTKDLLVIVDDFALPLGRLRLRPKGSDGGHNGLKSVHALLQTDQYARLRIGIGPSNPAASYEAFVLERFKTTEKKILRKVLEEGAQACRLWATESIQAAMNSVNALAIKV